MSEKEVFELVRVVAVIALVVIAAVLATPPNRVPLALRGLLRILRRDGSTPTGNEPTSAPTWKKILSFVLVIVAFLLAKI